MSLLKSFLVTCVVTVGAVALVLGIVLVVWLSHYVTPLIGYCAGALVAFGFLWLTIHEFINLLSGGSDHHEKTHRHLEKNYR